MHYRYREILSRLYQEDIIFGSGVSNDEAFLVTQDRLIIYGNNGWISEFQLDEISYDIVEIRDHKFLEIIDLHDPTAENYFYYGLYKQRDAIISLLNKMGVD